MTATAMRRTHVVLPEELIDEIDRRLGRLKRSKFLAEAAEERLRRLRLLEAFDEVAGSLANGGPPEWSTPESTSAWVRALREETNQGLPTLEKPEW